MKKIRVRHTSTIISDYHLGDCKRLEDMLSTWNKLYFTTTPYYTYEEDTNTLRIPRGVDINFLERAFDTRAELDYNHDEFVSVSFKIKSPPRDDIQRKALSFLVGENGFNYTKNHSQLSLNLPTGDGKTYCCIAAMTFLSMRTLIVTHKDSIKQQWIDSLYKFTTLDKEHICDVDSSKKIDTLIKNKSKIKYKVFLINHRAIHSYCKKHGWDKLQSVFEALGIGLKIYDEAHKEFANIMRVDQYTNTKKTFYVTANFEKSSYQEDLVFKNAFANVMKFGVETLVEKKRYIVYMPYIFNSKPSTKDKLKIKNKAGFDRNYYCDYHLTKPDLFNICNDLVTRFIKKNDNKILVLFSKIVAVESYAAELKKLLPDERIGVVHSKLEESEKDEAKMARIIVSTPQSIGTGDDISGLGCVIMTEPYSSKITANQVSGRLRYLGNDQDSFYIELVDSGFEAVMYMYKERLKFFKKKCKQIILMRE